MNITEWLSPNNPVQNIFLYALGISAIFALGLVAYGAIKRATAKKKSLKEKETWTWAAIQGLVIITGSYLIISAVDIGLSTINDRTNPSLAKTGTSLKMGAISQTLNIFEKLGASIGGISLPSITNLGAVIGTPKIDPKIGSVDEDIDMDPPADSPLVGDDNSYEPERFYILGRDPKTGDLKVDSKKMKLDERSRTIAIINIPTNVTVAKILADLNTRISNRCIPIKELRNESKGKTVRIIIAFNQTGQSLQAIVNKLFTPVTNNPSSINFTTGPVFNKPTSQKYCLAVEPIPIKKPNDEIPTIQMGVIRLAQGDPRWGKIRYGKAGCKNFSWSGCAPTSFAMVLLYFTGNQYATSENAVTTVGSLMTTKGYRICGKGTVERAFVSQNIPAQYGLTSYVIPETPEDLKTCFESGGVAIGHTKTNSIKFSLSDLTWQPRFGNHYLVLDGMSLTLDATGKINPDTNIVYFKDPSKQNTVSSQITHYFNAAYNTYCIQKP